MQPNKVDLQYHGRQISTLHNFIGHVAVSRGYNTYFRKGLVMGYADCKTSK